MYVCMCVCVCIYIYVCIRVVPIDDIRHVHKSLSPSHVSSLCSIY